MITIESYILLVIGVLCCIIGNLLTVFIIRRRRDGIFHINTSDPNKDYIRFEMISPIGVLEKKKIVYFTVDNEADLKQ